MLKRWWWVAAVVVAVAVMGAFLLKGQGGPAVPGPGGQASAGTGTPAPGSGTTSTMGPGSPSSPATGTSKPSNGKTLKVVPEGKRLTTITAPPNQTLAQINYTASREGQTYRVAFSLYGTGPVRAGHATLVAALSSFAATKTYPDALKLPSDNVLLEPAPGVNVTAGGTYTGVVTLTKRGDALVLVVSKVKAS